MIPLPTRKTTPTTTNRMRQQVTKKTKQPLTTSPTVNRRQTTIRLTDILTADTFSYRARRCQRHKLTNHNPNTTKRVILWFMTIKRRYRKTELVPVPRLNPPGLCHGAYTKNTHTHPTRLSDRRTIRQIMTTTLLFITHLQRIFRSSLTRPIQIKSSSHWLFLRPIRHQTTHKCKLFPRFLPQLIHPAHLLEKDPFPSTRSQSPRMIRTTCLCTLQRREGVRKTQGRLMIMSLMEKKVNTVTLTVCKPLSTIGAASIRGRLLLKM